MNAIAYVRYASKSVEDRVEIGDNPQENAIKDYCTANHINLCEVFHDIGVSGTNFERQGWQQLEIYLDGVDGFIELLIVSDYGRISRNTFEGVGKMEFLQNKHGLTIVALSDSHIPDGDELRKLLLDGSNE